MMEEKATVAKHVRVRTYQHDQGRACLRRQMSSKG